MARRGNHDEALPVLWGAHRQPVLLQEIPIDRFRLGVIEALLGGELDGYADQLEGGEVGSREVLRRAAVDDLSREAGQEFVAAVRPLRRGGEGGGGGGEGHLRGDRILRGGEGVEPLVEDPWGAGPRAPG